jgi:hypothetical protein
MSSLFVAARTTALGREETSAVINRQRLSTGGDEVNDRLATGGLQ